MNTLYFSQSILEFGPADGNTPSRHRLPVVSILRNAPGPVNLNEPSFLTHGLFAGHRQPNREQQRRFAARFGSSPDKCRLVVLATPTSEACQVIFAYPRKSSPLEAMGEIFADATEHSRPSPPLLLAAAIVFGANMSSSLDVDRQQWAGHVFSQRAGAFFDRMNSDEPICFIEDFLLKKVLGDGIVDDSDGSLALSDFDLVNFACEIGRLLWLHPIRFPEDTPPEVEQTLGGLAWAHLVASNARSLTCGQDRIAVHQPVRTTAWFHFNQIAACDPPPGALSFLLANGLPAVDAKALQAPKQTIRTFDQATSTDMILEMETAATSAGYLAVLPDPARRAKLIDALVLDGQHHRRLKVDSAGSRYIVNLPKWGLPRRLGYERIRLFCFFIERFGEVVLYAFEGQEGVLGPIWTGAWEVSRSITGDELSDEIKTDAGTALEIAVMGLWRDIMVADTAAVPLTTPAAKGKAEVRTWGSPEEAALIQTGQIDLTEARWHAQGLAITSWILAPAAEQLAAQGEEPPREPEPYPIVPRLKPADWDGRDTTLCRPLDRSSNPVDVPLVVFGYDKGSTISFPEPAAWHEAGLKPDQVERTALEFLKGLAPQWKEDEIQGERTICRMLQHTGDYAAEQILNRSFLRQADKLLGGSRLAVCAPTTSCLLAARISRTAGNIDDPIGLFVIRCLITYAEGRGHRISPRIFQVERGGITGWMEIPREMVDHFIAEAAADDDTEVHVTPVAEGEEFSVQITVSGSRSNFVAEHVQSHVAAAGNESAGNPRFNGRISVVIVPGRTPDHATTPELDERLRTILKMHQSLGMQTVSGRPIVLSIRYGDRSISHGDAT